MEYGLGTAMASMAFLFVIISIYRTKDMKPNSESRLFKYITIACSFLCISTMAHAILLKKLDIFWLNLISWRTYVFSIIAFIELLIMYIISLEIMALWLMTSGFTHYRQKKAQRKLISI